MPPPTSNVFANEVEAAEPEIDVERLGRALAKRHSSPHSRFDPPLLSTTDQYGWSGTITSIPCDAELHREEANAIVAAYEAEAR